MFGRDVCVYALCVCSVYVQPPYDSNRTESLCGPLKHVYACVDVAYICVCVVSVLSDTAVHEYVACATIDTTTFWCTSTIMFEVNITS